MQLPGDELVGDFTRAQLVRMDDRFRQRLLRAFETGAESREAAVATLGANASRRSRDWGAYSRR